MNKLTYLITEGTRWAAALTLSIVSAVTAAAITLDNTASAGVFNPLITPQIGMTWTHTVNSCTNCVLYIGISTYEQTATLTSPVVSITYNGVDITSSQIGFQASPSAVGISPRVGNSTVQMYRLVAPPTGSGNIIVTFSPSLSYVFGSSFSFNGVNQTTPNGPWNSTGGDSFDGGPQPSLSVSGGATGSVILDILGSTPTGGFFAPSSSQVVCGDSSIETTCTRGRTFFSSAFDIGAMGRKASAGTSNTTSWTMSGSDVWALGAIAITPDAPTAGGASVQGQVLTPDGRAVGGATIYAQDNKGSPLAAISNPFGYFSFDDLNSGDTYIFSVYSKSFDFQPVALTINENLSGVQILALVPDAAKAPADRREDARQRPVMSRSAGTPRFDP